MIVATLRLSSGPLTLQPKGRAGERTSAIYRLFIVVDVLQRQVFVFICSIDCKVYSTLGKAVIDGNELDTQMGRWRIAKLIKQHVSNIHFPRQKKVLEPIQSIETSF